MAKNLLSRLRGKADISRAASLTLNQYLQQLVEGRLGYGYMQPYVQFGVDGRPTERTPATFETYARDIYAAHPVIFGLMEARRSVFSEARFCWRAVKDGNPGDVLPISDGLELLNAPWPGAQSGTLISRMRQDADLGGTAFVVREEGRLRRLRPDWVTIVLSGNPWEDLRVDMLGIAYAPNGPDNSPVETYLPDEFAMFAPIPDPLAQFRGMSWLTPVIREIEADNAATTHRKSTLEKGAWLGPIVSAPQGTTLEQFKKFVEAADSAHAGPNNAGRMVFLAPGSEVKTVAQSLKDLDMKGITGSAETRIAVASRVPAVIAQIAEGLQGSSLNTGNYTAAKRQWIDGSLRPDWRSLCEALSVITPPPDLSGLDLPEGTTAQLWILESDIALLHEDRLEAAQVRSANATTINTLVTAGFEPDSIVVAVRDDDLSALKHSGLTSVQLLPPGQSPDGTTPAAGAEGAEVPDAEGESEYQRALEELRAGAGDAQRSQILRADVDHSGAMIALVPSEEDAQRLAVDDGEPVDDLHLTLFYLGEASDIPAAQRQSIVDAVDAAVRRRNVPVLELNAFGAALWNPHGDEPAWVLNVGDPQQRPEGQESLAVIRRAVGDALAYGAPEFRMPRQHSPFAAHVCVAYGADIVDADELADRTGSVVFDRLRVAFGGRATDIPLRGVQPDEGTARSRRPFVDRAQRRDGDGDGKHAAYKGGPDIVPNVPTVLDPEAFRRSVDPSVADRLAAGEPPRQIADDLRRRAGQFRRTARSEEDEDRREFLLRVARDHDALAARVRSVADLPLKRKRATGPSPRPVTGRLRGEADRPPPPPRVPPAKPPSRRMTPEEQRIADALAAGRISNDTAVALLTGKKPEGFDPETAGPFVTGMVHAGYITELAWTGDRERLEAHLRRQNTATLFAAAPFFGLSLPSDAGHERVVAAFADRAMQLEAPRRELPSTEELRQSLTSRKVKDLQASLRAAGLPVSGRKAELVDRLVAAYSAARGGGDGATDRPDRGAGLPPGRDGRGRGRGAARPLDAGREPDAGATGPAAGGVGGGDDAGDLTGRPRLSPDPAVRAVQVENRIRQAYRESPKLGENYVRLADLRAHPLLRDLDRAEVDATLIREARRGDSVLTPEEDRRRLRPGDREAAIEFGGDQQHWLSFDDSSLRPLPAAPAKKAAAATKASSRMATAEKIQAARETTGIRVGSRVTAPPGTAGVGTSQGVEGVVRRIDLLFGEPVAVVRRDDGTDAAVKLSDLTSSGETAPVPAKAVPKRTALGHAVGDRVVYAPPGARGRLGTVTSVTPRKGEDPTLVLASVRFDDTGRTERVLAGSLRKGTPESARATATPAKRTPSLPSRPGRVSVSDSRDWTPAQHVAHAEQARRNGDNAEARLHRGLADTKNSQLAESGQGVEHLRSLTDRDDARRFLRSLTRAQLDDLAGRLGVDTTGSRDAVIARILAELFGG